MPKGSRVCNHPAALPLDPMPATPSDLFAFLDKLGIAHATVAHPALFTVEQSRELRWCVGARCNFENIRAKPFCRILLTGQYDSGWSVLCPFSKSHSSIAGVSCPVLGA